MSDDVREEPRVRDEARAGLVDVAKSDYDKFTKKIRDNADVIRGRGGFSSGEEGGWVTAANYERFMRVIDISDITGNENLYKERLAHHQAIGAGLKMVLEGKESLSDMARVATLLQETGLPPSFLPDMIQGIVIGVAYKHGKSEPLKEVVEGVYQYYGGENFSREDFENQVVVDIMMEQVADFIGSDLKLTSGEKMGAEIKQTVQKYRGKREPFYKEPYETIVKERLVRRLGQEPSL